MSEYELLKTAGPAGMGLFAAYLLGEKIVGTIRSKMNGNGLSHTLLTQKLFETMIEVKTEMKTQTELLKRLVDRLS